MLQLEYIRNMNCNYERLRLDRKPEENRYQYCILERGEIRGLLPCSLRYIDSEAYLYYDISSKQNISHLYSHQCIDRIWIRDFLWGMKQIQQELERFLLDINHILWHPEHIFQELESNFFSFLYVPYYKDENNFMRLLEFWVEHIDYADEELVECVYRMYERTERNGEVYLQSRIFKDAECLESKKVQNVVCAVVEEVRGEEAAHAQKELSNLQQACAISSQDQAIYSQNSLTAELIAQVPVEDEEEKKKKGVLRIFDGKKKRDKKLREEYRHSMQEVMTGHAVAEETSYNEKKIGQTVYVEKRAEEAKRVHRLYTPEGKILCNIIQQTLTIGKQNEGGGLILEDASVSRLHARIAEEKGIFYLEDLNSTNGTYKNDLRLLPYEKQILEEGDEIRCGNITFIFR